MMATHGGHEMCVHPSEPAHLCKSPKSAARSPLFHMPPHPFHGPVYTQTTLPANLLKYWCGILWIVCIEKESMEVETHDDRTRSRAFFTFTFSHRLNLLILFGVNVLIRGLWLLYMHPPQFFDFQWYYTHAVQLYHGEGYRAGHHYTAYWPIGYPFFLSLLFRLLGSSVWVGWIANALLSTGIVLLVYLTTLKLTAHSKISFAAALGYTMLPSQIEWNSVLGSEELFTFLLVLSLYIYLWTDEGVEGSRWWTWTVLSGLILGLACDVRPIPLLFPVFLLGYEL
jgi:hypothetical protein